jgi:hypothetical protein
MLQVQHQALLSSKVHTFTIRQFCP